jgi:hypothetical protein
MIKTTNEEYNTQYGEIVSDPFFIKVPELYEIFKRGIPPKEAYYFFPKGNDVIEQHNKKPEKNLRRIFINVPFLEIEYKWLEKYKEIIAQHPENKLPDFWNDGLNLAYIYSTECKLEKSYKRMTDYFQWYKTNFPLNIQPGDKCIEILNTGFVYAFGRDHEFRPILICQPYILLKNLKIYSPEDIGRASIFICQYVCNYMMIPGQIENWIMIINLDGTNILTVPNWMKKLMKSLSENYISRLFRCYIYGLNAFLRALFKLVCSFLEKATVEKVVILKNRADTKINQDINPENIEVRFGGKAPDLEYNKGNCIFPPRMPTNNHYLLENENPKDILITEEQYIEKLKAGQIPIKSISPFIPKEK